MASAANRKYVSKSNEEELLKSFYHNLGNDKNTFLGHKFGLEEGEDLSSISDKASGEN